MTDDGEVQGPAGTRFPVIRLVEETGSTNRDLLEEASRGAGEGLVLVTGHQTAGRGRQGRVWHDDPGSSLLCSVLLRPDPGWAPLIPLATGLAVVAGIERSAGVGVRLKWPNDVLAEVTGRGERKLCGILAEAAGSAASLSVVVGFGLNLRWPGDLPPEVDARAVDLASLTDAPVERLTVLASILEALEYRLLQLERGGLEALLEDYRRLCVTVGRRVRFDTPTGELVGAAIGVDASGGLVLELDAGGRRVLTAGEAHHLA